MSTSGKVEPEGREREQVGLAHSLELPSNSALFGIVVELFGLVMGALPVGLPPRLGGLLSWGWLLEELATGLLLESEDPEGLLLPPAWLLPVVMLDADASSMLLLASNKSSSASSSSDIFRLPRRNSA